MPSFHVRVQPVQTSDGVARVSAVLQSEVRGELELFYEVDERHRDAIVDRADPFVVAALVHALDEGSDLHVHGAPCSRSLLRNLEEFQQIWHTWFDYPVVDLIADDERDAPRPEGGAVVAFSGGVDSAFSAYTSASASPRHPPLGAGLMIHGMDIPRHDAAGFAGARQRSARMTDSLGIELITVRTNAWELLPHSRMHFSILGVSSALSLLGGRFGAGLIPSTATYGNPVLPLDSTPTSDALLRSDAFEIVHHGAAYSRLEKIRRLAGWDDAMRNLRFCLEDPHDHNCGRCRKCVLTYLELRALELEPDCFDERPSNDAVMRFVKTLSSHRLYVVEMLDILAECERHGLREPWVGAAKRRLRVIDARRALTALSPELSQRAARLLWKVQRRGAE